MNRVFTDWVGSLVAGQEPDPDLFDAVWEKLRDALGAEMRKRGLWSAPPCYLGIRGYRCWTQGDAFDELVHDAFTFLLDRLPSIKAQLRQKDNVEGFFFRCIRNFLYDSQKRHDPVGFRVFTVAQSAVRQLAEDGTLHVLVGDPGVRNDAVLGFAPDGDPNDARGGLDEHVDVWTNELMPELVTARGKHVDGVVRRLAVLISGLPGAAIEVFAFHVLVGLMKSDARRRWHAIWAQQEGETAFEDDGEDAFPVLVRLIRPDSGMEEREAFGKLVACVEARLGLLDEAQTTRIYLEKLWAFLRNHATEPAEGEPSADPKVSKLPSRRKIAQHLEIPRDHLKGLFETLGELVEECRAASSKNRQLGE